MENKISVAPNKYVQSRAGYIWLVRKLVPLSAYVAVF
jgi:hypothetical protein